jgi:hypothetical protein
MAHSVPASRRLSTELRQAASAGDHHGGGGAERGTVDGRDAAGLFQLFVKNALRLRRSEKEAIQAPGRAVMFTAWMKWDQRLWREHDRRRERMLRHAQ